MTNILIPACGCAKGFEDNYWPQNMYEVAGKPMIEYSVQNFSCFEQKKFIFVLNQGECDKFHTDNVVELLTDHNAEIIKLRGQTGGALCTCLMAIDFINNEEELIICNNDQKFDCNLQEAIDYFRSNNADSGVICFDSVHARWSYVYVEDGCVIEAAEKRPISRNAIAGFYYFKEGRKFVEAAKQAIKKKRTYDDKYFISAAINELILKGNRIMSYSINESEYHSFFSLKRIEAYEREIK